jgi:hypothetical protein
VSNFEACLHLELWGLLVVGGTPAETILHLDALTTYIETKKHHVRKK